MRRPLRLVLLALTLFAVPAAAPAQRVPLPGGNFADWVQGSPLLPIIWEGKPALLSICRGGDIFVSYTGRATPQIPKLTSFHLIAAFVQDTRPCAVGSPAAVNNWDQEQVVNLGALPPQGWFTWTGSVAMEYGSFWVSHKWYHRSFEIDYCDGMGACLGRCKGSSFDAPGLCAVVLTID